MPQRPPASDRLVGRLLGGYRVDVKLGAGATGAVYRAVKEETGEALAIKVLNENLGSVEALRRRFEREARALAKLQHPKIVHIADFGVVEEATFIAMELLEGDTLEELLMTAPLAPDTVLDVMGQILEGLAYAHEHRILHRDLKPANIYLTFPGGPPQVKVLDFGLAKFLAVDELSGDITLTRRGRIVGTPAYMAPEQITGVGLDLRADVYSAGVVLYELVADRRPFDYERRSQLLRAHLFEPVPPIKEIRPGVDLHPALEAVIMRALAKDPNERFQDAGEMLAALRNVPSAALAVEGRARGRQRTRSATSAVVISEAERRELTTGLNDPPAFGSEGRVAGEDTWVDAQAPLGAPPAGIGDALVAPAARRELPFGLVAMGVLVLSAALGFAAAYLL